MFVQDLLDNNQEDQHLKEEEGKRSVLEDEQDSEFDPNEDDGNQDEEEDDEEELEEQEREKEEEENPEMHKMKARSLVWKYFRKTLPAMAACNLCGKEICTVGNNTFFSYTSLYFMRVSQNRSATTRPG